MYHDYTKINLRNIFDLLFLKLFRTGGLKRTYYFSNLLIFLATNSKLLVIRNQVANSWSGGWETLAVQYHRPMINVQPHEALVSFFYNILHAYQPFQKVVFIVIAT